VSAARRWIVLAAACALLLILFVVYAARHEGVRAVLSRGHSGGDFVAFYCAGRIAWTHDDPYGIEPLRACEHRLDPSSAGPTPSDVTPAPLPGYTLALFGLLARLPYSIAMAVWYGALLSALIVSAWCLVRLTRLPLYVVLAALAIPFAYVNFVFAQLPPVAAAALCIAAYLLSERRFVAAGIAAACSMLEPHIGFPACVAVFLFVPASRLAVAAGACVLALASIATLGLHGNVEYFTRALPLHALAEAGASDQLSFTWFMHWFGASDRVAVLGGSLSYVVMLALGCAVGRAMARAYGADHFIVLLPPAIAMLGGAFVHNLQYAAVMPAALAVAAVLDTALAWAAVAVLAVPWQHAWHSKLYMAVASLALSLVAWYAVRHAPLLRRAALTVAAVFAFLLLTVGIAHLSDEPVQTASSPTAFFDSLGADQGLASALWGVRMRTDPAFAQASLQTFAEKLPPWTGLIVMIAAAIGAVAGQRRVAIGARANEQPARLPANAAVLIALVVANMCITLSLSAVLNLDTDESYSVHTTAGTAAYAFNQALHFEFQPPLYFVALWAWRHVNESVFFARLFSALCVALALVVVWAISKRIAPATNPAWITAAVAFNPFVIWCAVEMRVYALVLLWSALLLLTFFDGFLATPRSLPARIGFALTGIAGLYTFYYLGFLLVGFGAALLALRKWRSFAAFAAIGGVIAAALAPLVPIVAHQAASSGADFGARFSFGDNLALLTKLLALAAMPIRWAQWHGLWLVFLVALAAFGIHIIGSMARAWPPRLTPALGATACAVAVAGVAFVGALTFTQEPLANRYIAFLVVPIVVFGYAAFSAFDNYVRRALAGAALGLALLAGGISLFYDYGAVAKTGDWQRVAAYVMREERPDQPILVFQAEAALPLTYYYRGVNQLVPVPRALDMRTYDLRELILNSESDVETALARTPGTHRVIWVVTTDYCQTGALDFHCPYLESYLAKHYIVRQRIDFFKSTLRRLELRADIGNGATPNSSPARTAVVP